MKVVCGLDKTPEAPSGLRLIEAVVDSGADESVAPPGLFPGKVEPSPMSRLGKSYRAANGNPIANRGQQRVSFTTSEGRPCGMMLQVADVERPLLAASQLAQGGCSVVFETNGGAITNKATGESVPLVRRGGVYILRMYVAAGGRTSGFARPGH